MFYSGKLIRDISYPSLFPKKIRAIGTYKNQTIYLDDKQLFSNAWAGKIQFEHGLSDANIFAGGDDFHFLISNGEKLTYFDQLGNKLWSGTLKGILQLRYVPTKKTFLIVTSSSVAEYSPGQPNFNLRYQGSGITCATTISKGDELVIGTSSGYLWLYDKRLISALPCSEVTDIKEINGQLWFGSANGAYFLNNKGKYSYFAGERWLPGNHVRMIDAGPDRSVLILTDKGLGQLSFSSITLEEKALFYEKQVREKNIRYGFNCSSVGIPDGYSSGTTGNQPSDNLWTGMYLAAELFRYKVTRSEDAKENALEAFEAIERLHTVTNIPGLFARSFERDYKIENSKGADWKRKE